MEEFSFQGNPRSLTIETVRMDEETPSGEEQRNLLGTLLFDESGRILKKLERRRITFFEYDDQGNCIRETVQTPGGNPIEETTRKFSLERIIEETRGNEKKTYHYNNRGMKDYVTTFRNSHQESITSYGYDEEGRIIQIEIRDPDGQLLRASYFSRDPRGLIIREKIINQENMVLEDNLYEYPVFHKKNWLKRVCYSAREKTPLEILYRGFTFDSGIDDSPSVPAEPDTPDRSQDEESNSADTGQMTEAEEVIFSNGVYTGSLDDQGRPHGTGEFQGRDGSSYSGEFRNGLMEGKGDLVTPDGRHYKGDFLKNMPHGEGECLWPDGRRYRGNFREGMMHGIGVYYWPDGSRFTGLFDRNEPTEQGLLESSRDREDMA